MKTNELSNAMFALSFPCNPLPFLNGLAEGCKVNGSDYVQSDEGKRILYILIAQKVNLIFIYYENN